MFDNILDRLIIFQGSSPSVIRAGIASGLIQNEIHDMMTISPGKKSSIIFNFELYTHTFELSHSPDGIYVWNK